MKGRILIIEDEKIWQMNLRLCFEEAGYYVTIVNNLAEALDILKNQLFHLMTIDMNLDLQKSFDGELLEGWDVLKIIKKHQIDRITPTIVITGYPEHYLEISKQKKLSGMFFISKDQFSKDELLRIANREIERNDLRFYDDKRNK